MHVPEVTSAQKTAASRLKQAEDMAVAAKNAAGEATSVAAALKKVAEEYAMLKKKADEELTAANDVVAEAMAGKRSADEEALKSMKKAADQETHFLEKAFTTFDTANAGLLKPVQLQKLLATLKLPANNEDIDNLVQILDRKGWTEHMPMEMKQALRSHPLASQWSAE